MNRHLIFMNYDDFWKPEIINTVRYDGPFQGYRGAKEAAYMSSEQRERLSGNRDFTPAGVRTQMRAYVRTDLMKRINNAKSQAVGLKARMHETRARMRPPRPDLSGPPTLAGMSAIEMRREAREWARSLDPLVASATFSDPNVNRLLLDAVLEAPPELSGIPAPIRAEAERILVERAYPEEIKQLALDQTVLTVLEHATSYSLETLQQEAGFSSAAQFDAWLETAAN